MAWARYDDELPINRKVTKLVALGMPGLAAIGLHVLANTWSRHEGTGGFIPPHQPGVLAGDQKLGRRLAALLEEVGMFDVSDAERCAMHGEKAGWDMHDFDEYSDPDDDGSSAAEKKRRLSEVRSAAGRRGGLAKAAKEGGKPPSKSLANDVANGWHSSSPVPVPDPVLAKELSSSSNSSPPPALDDDDRFTTTIAIVVEAKAQQHKPRHPAPWKRTTTASTITEHGDAIRQHLAAECDPLTAASLVLGSQGWAEIGAQALGLGTNA